MALEPFDGDRPVGEDLRLDVSPSSIYFRLRDARAEARAEERQADNDPAAAGGVPSQWSLVRKLACEALQSRSKDVEVASWLTEALTRHDGCAGLAKGTDLLVGLISRFWDGGLFPAPEEDAPEDRLVAITGMSGEERDGSLLQPLRKIVLFARTDGTPLTVWEFERAREFVSLAATKPGQERGNVPSFADLEVEAKGIGQASLRALGEDVRRAEASWKALEDIVAQVADGDSVPATSRVRNMIELIRRLVERYVPEEPSAEVDASTNGAAAEAAETAPAAAAGANAPALPALPASREAMLDELIKIAARFRQMEPNSPLSFTIEEAVRRARMTWPELLRELIPDDNARTGVLAVAGLRPSTPPPSE